MAKRKKIPIPQSDKRIKAWKEWDGENWTYHFKERTDWSWIYLRENRNGDFKFDWLLLLLFLNMIFSLVVVLIRFL